MEEINSRAKELLINVSLLIEHDPFHAMGYKISKHVRILPEEKKFLLKKRKRIGNRIETKLPNGKKRRVSVYKHRNKNFGHIEHRTKDNHPLDSNFYRLERTDGKNNSHKETFKEVLNSSYPYEKYSP